MDRPDCSGVTEQDRDSQDRCVRIRYWRCRRGGESGWGGDSSDPEPTTTTQCDTDTQPTVTVSSPSCDGTSNCGNTSPFTGFSQTDIGDQTAGTKTSPTALIAGIASGIAVLIILGLVFWWFLRRRRNRQSPSPTKEGARSMEQQQQLTCPETQQIYPGQGSGREQIPESSRVIPYHPPSVTRHAVDKSRSSISSTSLPIQLPTFPSPTPRDRRLSTNHRLNASTSSVPYMECNPIPPQSYWVDSLSGYASQPTEVAVPPNDFYIDMLGLGTEKVLVNSNLTSAHPSATAPPRPPQPQPISAATSSSSSHPTSGPIPPPVSTRSRSSSIASLKKHSESARFAGASPKLSRDARQKVQQFPPPPPPPQVPPPAIPDEVLGQAPYSRSPRSRSTTTSFEGKEPLSQYWVPSPSNSRPSSYASNSGRKDGSSAKGKRSASRSASLSRKVTDPVHGHSPEPRPLPSQSPQPPEGGGGARDKRSLRSHRRSQSNIYGGSSTASMDALDRSLNMSPVQFRAPSSPVMPRPILRHNNSYGGHSSDSSDVEGIISGALAITAAKKQSDGTSLSVPIYQDKRLYI